MNVLDREASLLRVSSTDREEYISYLTTLSKPELSRERGMANCVPNRERRIYRLWLIASESARRDARY